MRCIVIIAALATQLAGCAKAESNTAAQLVDEARAIYEGRTKGKPGKFPGTFILGREDVGLCIEQLEVAQAKLKQVKAQYPKTVDATSSETQNLDEAVASQLGTCRRIKQQQGW